MTKSGIARVKGSINPRPPCATPIYAINMEAVERESVCVRRDRNLLASASIRRASGPFQESQDFGMTSSMQYKTSDPRRWGVLWSAQELKRRIRVALSVMEVKSLSTCSSTEAIALEKNSWANCLDPTCFIRTLYNFMESVWLT